LADDPGTPSRIGASPLPGPYLQSRRRPAGRLQRSACAEARILHEARIVVSGYASTANCTSQEARSTPCGHEAR